MVLEVGGRWRSRSLEVFHLLKLVVSIDDLQRDRTTQCRLLPNPGKNFHRIRLDALTATATITTLPSPQFVIDRIRFELQSGGKTIHRGKHGLAVRFAGCPVT